MSVMSITQSPGLKVDVQNQHNRDDGDSRHENQDPLARCLSFGIFTQKLRVVFRGKCDVLCAPVVSISRATLPRSRPFTLHVTSMRREVPSRLIIVGGGHDGDIGHVLQRHLAAAMACQSSVRAGPRRLGAESLLPADDDAVDFWSWYDSRQHACR